MVNAERLREEGDHRSLCSRLADLEELLGVADEKLEEVEVDPDRSYPKLSLSISENSRSGDRSCRGVPRDVQGG